MKKKIEIKRFKRDEKTEYLVMAVEDGRIFVLINGEEVLDHNDPTSISIPRRVRTARINGKNEVYFKDKTEHSVTYGNFYDRVHPMSKYVKSFDVTGDKLKVYEIWSNYYE